MKLLTLEFFNSWLEIYGKASRLNDPHASAERFSRKAKYYALHQRTYDQAQCYSPI